MVVLRVGIAANADHIRRHTDQRGNLAFVQLHAVLDSEIRQTQRFDLLHLHQLCRDHPRLARRASGHILVNQPLAACFVGEFIRERVYLDDHARLPLVGHKSLFRGGRLPEIRGHIPEANPQADSLPGLRWIWPAFEMEYAVGRIAPSLPHDIVGQAVIVAQRIRAWHRLQLAQEATLRVRQEEGTSGRGRQHRPDDPGDQILARPVPPRGNVHEARQLIANADVAVIGVPHELDRSVRDDISEAADGGEHIRAVDQARVAGNGQRISVDRADHPFLQRWVHASALRLHSQSASPSLSFLSYQPAALLLAVRSSR